LSYAGASDKGQSKQLFKFVSAFYQSISQSISQLERVRCCNLLFQLTVHHPDGASSVLPDKPQPILGLHWGLPVFALPLAHCHR
jgi:hypothetical protein